MCRECFALRQHTTIQTLENFKFTPTINGLSCISKLIVYLWALQVDLCLPVHVSHPYELQLKTQIKSCILNCKKPLLSIITGRKRYTWGGVLFFESNESVVVTQLTSLLKLTTVHEHLDGFYNRVKVGMLFTLSSIRKTLIICPAKQKPSTNLLCIA